MDENKKFNKKYFNGFWRSYRRRKFHPIYDFRVWYITKLLKPKNLLDIGCGLGLMIEKLRKKTISVKGVDISRTALLLIPKELQKVCCWGDILNLPVKDRSYDVVTCIDVLEHLEKNNLIKAIIECARTARRVIYFEITCLEDILFINSDPTHVSKMFSWQWEKLLRNSLCKEWKIKRGPILPFLRHGIFIVEKMI